MGAWTYINKINQKINSGQLIVFELNNSSVGIGTDRLQVWSMEVAVSQAWIIKKVVTGEIVATFFIPK
ncbi:hypothetical protein D3C73_1590590 [compost metagenome]